MGDRETLPVNHSTGSHVMHVGGGAVGGGVKGLFAGLGVWLLGLCTVTGLAGLGIGALAGAPLIGLAIGVLAPAVVVGGGAALLGVVAAPVVGAGIGAVKGADGAHRQVQRDRAAANMVDAEVGAMQAQAAAMQAQAQMAAAGGRPGDRYAGASTMNQAGMQLDAATAARAGMVNAPQLEAARG